MRTLDNERSSGRPAVAPWERDPEVHYDRIMPAWRLLMGRNLHYGYFSTPDEDLDAATNNLTARLAHGARLDVGLDVLDVGCGDGQNSCFLAEQFGCQVTGISTGKKGVARARRLARERGLARTVAFEVRDGMDNGFADASFDRVWVLQSSHFMLDKGRLLAECARVLRPGGRVALGDIILRSPLPLSEVVRYREEFLLLHRVFGRAKMEPLPVYQSLAEASGLQVEVLEDVTTQALPTFDRWRRNGATHRDRVIELVGQTLWREFLAACDVLETFWKQGRFGYGLLAASKP